ncbi:dihydrodipicolinate reductase [Hasllibacter halocynthiae]|uniref:4-hydroxy-tetrahydrodipicolinate reductase n=1 Tax=Hasllibacter halocynthiae TaxID=595589 RepID=A0A2T0X1C2_9RHOB|nr:4-hydroxy-tetrahydrodipicolinate reductase [Hasllibacter halocynthiae]PRY92742.1 dihydrodipicolinate reductase [Hasllibacter halocynthiae]
MDGFGVVIHGASGRMGRMLLRVVAETDGMHLAGALDAPGSEWVGRDAGALEPLAQGLTVTDDAVGAMARAQAVIDFSTPEASLEIAALAAQARAACVIGTTGFTVEQERALEPASRHCPIVKAGNMSLGVNLLTGLVRQVAGALPGWDVEVVEAHHARKVDAPSGTALMLGEAAAEGRGLRLADVAERGRDGITGPRAEGAIGFAVIRGGDVVGEHDVIFHAPGERVVLRHLAADRAIFARGAARAAAWAQGRAPGLYGMDDVLGLRTEG